MNLSKCCLAVVVLVTSFTTLAQAQSLFDDSSMRKETAERIATTHGIRLDWQRNTLMQLMNAESRLDTVKRIKRNHGVEYDWRKSTLMQLMDAETRMDTAKRISRTTGQSVDWKKYSLMQLMEMELRASGVDVEAVKKVAAGQARQGKGAAAGQPVYITKIDEDKDDVLILANGCVVEITRGFLGFVGFRKDVVLFKHGSRWKIWIEGKEVYNCNILKAPSGRATGSGQTVYISEVKGDGKILMMLDGAIYEVDDLNTIDTALWLGNSDALLIDGKRLINFDDADEIIDVTKLK